MLHVVRTLLFTKIQCIWLLRTQIESILREEWKQIKIETRKRAFHSNIPNRDCSEPDRLKLMAMQQKTSGFKMHVKFWIKCILEPPESNNDLGYWWPLTPIWLISFVCLLFQGWYWKKNMADKTDYFLFRKIQWGIFPAHVIFFLLDSEPRLNFEETHLNF